jgi:hypothetical protein
MASYGLVLSFMVLTCVCSTGNAQSSEKQRPTAEQLEQLRQSLDRDTSSKGTVSNELATCQAKLDEWKKWGDETVPKCRASEARNIRLQEQLDSDEGILWRIGIAFVAFGAGFCGAYVIVKSIKRVWPLSPARKQLIVLLAMAAWMSIAALLSAADRHLLNHPVDLAFSVLVYSIPALAFGGIGFWWFGKGKQAQSGAA